MSLRISIRDHVPSVTLALTLFSLAMVFGAVLRVVPVAVLPRAPTSLLEAIPHVNALLSTTAIATVLGGVLAIRRGRVGRHRALMLVSLGLFVCFLVLYLYKVALTGPTPFPGPDSLYRFVYLPVLAVHILLAIVCLPLLYYVALLGLTRPVAAIRESRHRRVGRVAAALWVVSFVLGDAVYLLLYVVY